MVRADVIWEICIMGNNTRLLTRLIHECLVVVLGLGSPRAPRVTGSLACFVFVASRSRTNGIVLLRQNAFTAVHPSRLLFSCSLLLSVL
jgi:hypothetical protein